MHFAVSLRSGHYNLAGIRLTALVTRVLDSHWFPDFKARNIMDHHATTGYFRENATQKYRKMPYCNQQSAESDHLNSILI